MNKENILFLLKNQLPQNSKIIINNKKSYIIKIEKKINFLLYYINEIFFYANENIIKDLIYYLQNFNKKSIKIKNIKKNLLNYYTDNFQPESPDKKNIINLKFKYKNLKALFDDIILYLKELYKDIDFNIITISWGRKYNKKRKRSIRFGSYNIEKKIILINPILDNNFFPDHFIKSIIFHEIAHYIYYYLNPDNKKSYHGKIFKEILQKIDKDLNLSKKWLNSNLKRIFNNNF